VRFGRQYGALPTGPTGARERLISRSSEKVREWARRFPDESYSVSRSQCVTRLRPCFVDGGRTNRYHPNGGLINTDDVEVSRRSDVIVRPS
jgi:hypothetical protein